jgi:hypothetical protein
MLTFLRNLLFAAMAIVGAAAPVSANPYNVSEIPRLIAAADARKLHEAGVHTTDELLRRAATVDQRKQLAKQAGLRGARVDQLARWADLLRLQDIGPEWVMLLEAAGVKSVPDLATRDAAELTRKGAALNRVRHIANPAPTEAQVRGWIAQAGKLPAALTPK